MNYRPNKASFIRQDLNSTLSDNTQTRHPRREAGIQSQGR